jgi:hypothetical protein
MANPVKSEERAKYQLDKFKTDLTMRTTPYKCCYFIDVMESLIIDNDDDMYEILLKHTFEETYFRIVSFFPSFYSDIKSANLAILPPTKMQIEIKSLHDKLNVKLTNMLLPAFKMPDYHVLNNHTGLLCLNKEYISKHHPSIAYDFIDWISRVPLIRLIKTMRISYNLTFTDYQHLLTGIMTLSRDVGYTTFKRSLS